MHIVEQTHAICF